MERVELELYPREAKVGNDVTPKQIRAQGWVPGVVYGHGEPVSIVIEEKGFVKTLKGSKAGAKSLFNLKVNGKTDLGIIREIQRHLLKHNPIHIDFQRINPKEKLDIAIPTHPVGEANGVKNQGGILEHITHEIRIRCLPDDIPTSFDVDVTNLNLGQSIRISDIAAPKGVEILSPKENIIVNIVAPKVEEVTPAPGATPAEPEVIAKGKEKDGAAAPADAKAGDAKAAAAAPAKDEKKK